LTVDLIRLRVLQVALPYASIVAVLAVLASEFANFGSDPRYSSVLYLSLLATYACYVFALLLIRQFLALQDNIRLSNSLTLLSERLEQRVSERTESLSALNQAAAALALCRTAHDALETGLSHALLATRLNAGLVWTLGRKGELDLAASQGILSDSLSQSDGMRCAAILAADCVRGGTVAAVSLDGLQDSRSDRGAEQRSAVGIRTGAPSLLLVPVTTQGSVLGAFGLEIGDLGGIDEARQSLALSIGSQTAVALRSARRYEEIRALSERDPVTGLLNHRAFHSRLEQETRRAARAGASIAVVMMDLDGFKLFNDTYGHPVGDQVLRAVATHLLVLKQER
jgi:GAF domain-containing protein